MMNHEQVDWKNGSIEVAFTYVPADRGLREGNLQIEPDYPEEIEVESVEFDGKDVTALFDEEDFELIVEKLFELRNVKRNEYDGD